MSIELAIQKTHSWIAGLLLCLQLNAKNILQGKNEQGLKQNNKKAALEHTQESKHEEVYVTSGKMSSTKESSAGNNQPGCFKCQEHSTPDTKLSMRPFNTTNSLWWSKNELYISLRVPALLIKCCGVKTSNYKAVNLS